MGNLFRANSRIAIHLGEVESYRISAIASLDALKAGLGAHDPRAFAQRLEVADGFAHLGRPDDALEMYKAVAHEARDSGVSNMEGFALFKRAVLNTVSARVYPAIYADPARRSIRDLAKTTDPHLAPFRDAVGLLAVQLSAKGEKDPAYDKLIASYRGKPSRTPQLIYAPPIRENGGERALLSGSTLGRLRTSNYDGQWADIGFWVMPDGRVADANLVLGAKKLDKHWPPPVLDAIRHRRYAPLALAADAPGVLRVERYTRTTHWISGTGTHMRVREPFPRIEMLDLTEQPRDDPPATTPTAPTVIVATPATTG